MRTRTCLLIRSLSILLALLWSFGHCFAQQSNVANAEVNFSENPAAIYGKLVRYDVFRNDKKIGEHIVEFDLNENTLLVSSLSKLVVRYLGIPVYRYTYGAKEIWQAGVLQSVESEIRDNRKDPRVIKVDVRDRVIEITDFGKSRLAPIVRFATTHWHPGALKVTRMFHTTHGKVRNFKLEDLGSERIALNDPRAEEPSKKIDVSTRVYQISGGFGAKLWYDEHDRWVRLQFNADDGSRIDYKCTTCAPR